jgi:tetratricopeptide (TPR) repeat protein
LPPDLPPEKVLDARETADFAPVLDAMFPELNVFITVSHGTQGFEIGPLSRRHLRSLMETIDKDAIVNVWVEENPESINIDAVAAAVWGFKAGNALWKRGELDPAKVAYRTSIRAGLRETTGKSAFNLACIEQQLGNIEAAVSAFRTALATLDPEAAPAAGEALGSLLIDHGREDEAIGVYSAAMGWSPAAAFNLGVLLERRDDLRGACAAFETAIAGNDPKVTPLVVAKLPRVVYEEALTSGDPDAVYPAAYKLGQLFRNHREFVAAAQAYRFAMRAPDPEVAAQAQAALRDIGQCAEQSSGAN